MTMPIVVAMAIRQPSRAFRDVRRHCQDFVTKTFNGLGDLGQVSGRLWRDNDDAAGADIHPDFADARKTLDGRLDLHGTSWAIHALNA